MQNYQIFVEGETEERLLKELKVIGKIKKINLWDKDISKLLRTFKPNTAIFVIYDTDAMQSDTNIARFNANLAILKRHKYLAGILQQTKNFEDELVYSCHQFRTVKDLFNAFNAVNADEFKTKFLKANNPLEILAKFGFDKYVLWQKPTNPNVLRAYHEKRVGIDKLPGRWVSVVATVIYTHAMWWLLFIISAYCAEIRNIPKI